ncbi:MAG: hypothetical protein KDJ15_04875 [Alphaproteobacteria bacterium]|nr:hypothetical protein [Alphaproteobacteria bacterium]
MINVTRKTALRMSAGFVAGFMLSTGPAHAQSNNFTDVTSNIVDSIEDFPSLVSSFSYLLGLVFGVLGILKIKDHVESPGNAPLKEGAIRLGVGGALLALPFMYDVMLNTVGDDQGAQDYVADLYKADATSQ